VEGPVLVYTESTDGRRRSDLEGRGAQVALLPDVEPAAVLADLYERGVRSVLVEGGGEVLASFTRSGLYDQVRVDCAPLLIGGRTAPGPLAGEGFPSLQEAARLEHFEARARGGDLLLSGYRQGCIGGLLARVLP
jgi:diaminohydroxyphosphoribosylaminopyrimidine deaminase/5-amino-6-(5-phosphoribosylamino)uracil reductase